MEGTLGSLFSRFNSVAEELKYHGRKNEVNSGKNR